MEWARGGTCPARAAPSTERGWSGAQLKTSLVARAISLGARGAGGCLLGALSPTGDAGSGGGSSGMVREDWDWTGTVLTTLVLIIFNQSLDHSLELESLAYCFAISDA